ncbi:MAG: alpha/beta hydrolase-fold protein [Chthoniobacter sp.]|nr:alpha/beta hydrolase-fold protein [Chthoniobacter sp.]
MKSIVFSLALLASFTVATVAQQPAAAPRRPEQRLVSPEVDQGKVTFRFAAPKAQQVNVRINGRKDPVAMQRDDKGVWTATVEDLTPEIYDYQFDVDGLITLDPANAWVKSGLRPNGSLVEVPAHPAEFWEAINIPHGNVTIHTFWSKSLEAPRSFRVYTPPGYDLQTAARFPVLYLLHGSGDLDDGWMVVGRANFIADNLLAAGKMKPMLIVMPNGTYPREAGHENDFETALLQEIIPTVEKEYRVAPGAANRALAGLSMGGFQTLSVGVKHLDQFAWLGVFSAGVRDNAGETYGPFLDKANDQLSLFWIGIGEDDFLLQSEKALETLLNDHHVKYSAHLSKGGHAWYNWRHYLHDFLPLLFQPAGK